MADNMIEKVARAICWKNGMDPDLTLGGDGQNFLWMEYEGQAGAAIAAMRTPTDEMKSEGDCYMPALMNDGLMKAGYDVVGEVWQAMVGKALEPVEEQPPTPRSSP